MTVVNIHHVMASVTSCGLDRTPRGGHRVTTSGLRLRVPTQYAFALDSRGGLESIYGDCERTATLALADTRGPTTACPAPLHL